MLGCANMQINRCHSDHGESGRVHDIEHALETLGVAFRDGAALEDASHVERARGPGTNDSGCRDGRNIVTGMCLWRGSRKREV